MPLLSENEYHATFGSRMLRAGPDDAPPLEFWPYFESIPQADFEGADCSDGEVRWVYRDMGGRFEHVLVSSTEKNTFMVLVLDRNSRTVLGHRLLNLRKEYGLDDLDAGAA